MAKTSLDTCLLTLLCLGILATPACLGGRVTPDTASPSTSPATSSPSSTTSTTTNPLAPASSAGNVQAVGAACGYQNMGHLLHVADSLDVCLPPTACTSEVCPPPLGKCVAGSCVMGAGYKGIQTLPQAWATYYCQLSTGGCNGVTQAQPPADTAATLAAQLNLPVCEGAAQQAACIGIAASSPMMVGNSQLAVDAASGAQVRNWGLGLSEASNVCYHLTGPGGDAFVALTDRCGGYCKCNGSGYQECGACVNANDMTPNCPCVGAAPGVADACCGAGCAQPVPACDWCATNNHPHFDLDQATFNHLCGSQTVLGSCRLTAVVPFVCTLGTSWPPP